MGAVTAVTWRAFVTRPGGDGGHRGRRDRRDRGDGIPLGFAMAAVTTVTVEPRPARALIWWGEGLAVDESVTIGSCDRRVGTHFAARPKVAAALNQNV